jgi:hypothetical protein
LVDLSLLHDLFDLVTAFIIVSEVVLVFLHDAVTPENFLGAEVSGEKSGWGAKERGKKEGRLTGFLFEDRLGPALPIFGKILHGILDDHLQDVIEVLGIGLIEDVGGLLKDPEHLVLLKPDNGQGSIFGLEVQSQKRKEKKTIQSEKKAG